MNLLKDKREQENEAPWPSGRDVNSQTTYDPLPPRGSSGAKRDRSTRQGSSQNMIIAAALVFLVVLLGYYIGVVKPKQAMKNTASVEPVPAAADTLGEQKASAPVEEKATAETPTVSGSTMQPEALSPQVDVKTLAGAAAALLRSAVQSSGESGRITAFVLNDKSFSIEMDGGGAQAQTVAAAFRAALPSIVSVGEPMVQGRAILFSGSFGVEQTSIESHAFEAWQASLKQMAGNSDLSVENISSLQSGRLLFAKFHGSLQSCLKFLDELAKESASHRIDRIILSASAANDYSFVLRIQL